jgi:hypothetical protein
VFRETSIRQFRASHAIVLMMEKANTPETSVNFHQTTRRINPEDSHLSYSPPCELEISRQATFISNEVTHPQNPKYVTVSVRKE